jgi:DNA-binding PadR family transcriptional regulator
VTGPLSEIEGCVLALLHEWGPATPYALRKEFLNSPTPQWSGSAGTIYPLIARLQRRGLVRAKLHPTGARPGRRISLSASGRRAFRSWLSIPVPDWVAGIPPDPLRTRVRFLEALSVRERRAFIVAARRAARRQLRVLEADVAVQRALGPFHCLMSRGALLAMQARLDFLDESAKSLSLK